MWSRGPERRRRAGGGPNPSPGHLFAVHAHGARPHLQGSEEAARARRRPPCPLRGPTGRRRVCPRTSGLSAAYGAPGSHVTVPEGAALGARGQATVNGDPSVWNAGVSQGPHPTERRSRGQAWLLPGGGGGPGEGRSRGHWKGAVTQPHRPEGPRRENVRSAGAVPSRGTRRGGGGFGAAPGHRLQRSKSRRPRLPPQRSAQPRTADPRAPQRPGCWCRGQAWVHGELGMVPERRGSPRSPRVGGAVALGQPRAPPDPSAPHPRARLRAGPSSPRPSAALQSR